MDWQYLSENVYFKDGSLRDIVVSNTTANDWVVWADYVNANYRVTFQKHDDSPVDDRVEMNKVFEFWESPDNVCVTANVFLNDIQLSAHFFDDKEIENDITPLEVNSILDHEMIIDYMVGLSKALNKTVILTPENTHDETIISVSGDLISII